MQPLFFSNDWCGLSWSDWQPLGQLKTIGRTIPDVAGIYRVRPQDGEQLTYIGQTRMGLRARLRMLAHCYREEMPFNDPHTAAPCLWAWRVHDGMAFEFSVAPVSDSDQERQVLEDMLLWQHRLEYGESTLANHGRFHSRYSRPSNRKQGRQGQQLASGQINPASGNSLPPLQWLGQPPDQDWMGLPWSTPELFAQFDREKVPAGDGLYKILDHSTGRLLYIGESSQLSRRLVTHSRKSWEPYQPTVSYHVLPAGTLPHQRHEWEVDLIGAYYAVFGQPPVFQYRNH